MEKILALFLLGPSVWAMSLRRERENVEKVIFMNVPLNFIKTYSKVWGEVMNVQEGVKVVVDKLKRFDLKGRRSLVHRESSSLHDL